MSESVASEVVSAMIGGMFSASALYPLEVLKTRMQAESKSTTSKNKEEDKKDLPNEQEPNDGESEEETKQKSSNNKQLTYEEAASQGMKSYAKLMYENEGGIAPFYSGVITSAVQSATEKALYFFAYTFYKNG